MTPTEVASTLGLDRVPAVVAVELTDEAIAEFEAAAAARNAEFAEVAEGIVPRAAGERRVRGIVMTNG